MEKHSHIFRRFIAFGNMYDGYLLARRHKRKKGEVLEYSANLEDNLLYDQERLENKTYHTGKPQPFFEWFPKKRLIHSLPFNDRVVNCAAYLQLWPIYCKSFYEHSYGSIPDGGTLKAIKRLQDWMRMVQHKPGWVIGKMDVAKFFFRIPTEVQLRELGRPLDDPDMMWFLETAIRCDGRAFGLPLEYDDVATAERVPGRGMQVGSLISQMSANVVLTPLDHYIKRVLRIPYYIRYMDDMVFLCESRQQAWEATQACDEFLRSGFGLQLNHKTAVMPVRHGVEFIGRNVYLDRVQLRKGTTLRMKQHLAYVMKHYALGELELDHCISVFISYYLGLLPHTNSEALRQKILDSFVLVRNVEQYREAIGYLSSGKEFQDFAPVDGYGRREPLCWGGGRTDDEWPDYDDCKHCRCYGT